jgi:hypothetical protein
MKRGKRFSRSARTRRCAFLPPSSCTLSCFCEQATRVTHDGCCCRFSYRRLKRLKAEKKAPAMMCKRRYKSARTAFFLLRFPFHFTRVYRVRSGTRTLTRRSSASNVERRRKSVPLEPFAPPAHSTSPLTPSFGLLFPADEAGRCAAGRALLCAPRPRSRPRAAGQADGC